MSFHLLMLSFTNSIEKYCIYNEIKRQPIFFNNILDQILNWRSLYDDAIEFLFTQLKNMSFFSVFIIIILARKQCLSLPLQTKGLTWQNKETLSLEWRNWKTCPIYHYNNIYAYMYILQCQTVLWLNTIKKVIKITVYIIHYE